MTIIWQSRRFLTSCFLIILLKRARVKKLFFSFFFKFFHFWCDSQKIMKNQLMQLLTTFYPILTYKISNRTEITWSVKDKERVSIYYRSNSWTFQLVDWLHSGGRFYLSQLRSWVSDDWRLILNVLEWIFNAKFIAAIVFQLTIVTLNTRFHRQTMS